MVLLDVTVQPDLQVHQDRLDYGEMMVQMDLLVPKESLASYLQTSKRSIPVSV